MNSLEKFEQLRNHINSLQEDLNKTAEQALGEAIQRCLENPTVDCIQWTQKSSEYDDYGLYSGISGPVLDCGHHSTIPDWATYSLPTIDSRLDGLRETLEVLGVEILCRILGEESLVTVKRSSVAPGYVVRVKDLS